MTSAPHSADAKPAQYTRVDAVGGGHVEHAEDREVGDRRRAPERHLQDRARPRERERERRRPPADRESGAEDQRDRHAGEQHRRSAEDADGPSVSPTMSSTGSATAKKTAATTTSTTTWQRLQRAEHGFTLRETRLPRHPSRDVTTALRHPLAMYPAHPLAGDRPQALLSGHRLKSTGNVRGPRSNSGGSPHRYPNRSPSAAARSGSVETDGDRHDDGTRGNFPDHVDGRQGVDARQARGVPAGCRGRRRAGDVLPGAVLRAVLRHHAGQEVLPVRGAGRRADRAAVRVHREGARRRDDPPDLRGGSDGRVLQHHRRGRRRRHDPAASTARSTSRTSRSSGRSSTSARATSATRSSTPRSARSARTSATTGTSPRAGASTA